MSIANSTNLQGAKIAIICDNRILTYLRDDFDHIPNPNQWDLPGGVREAHETALSCALRETHEEFGITLSKSAIVYEATYLAEAAGDLPKREVAFFACVAPEEITLAIRFGDEGQCWQMMPVLEFLSRENAVSELKTALEIYWNSEQMSGRGY